MSSRNPIVKAEINCFCNPPSNVRIVLSVIDMQFPCFKHMMHGTPCSGNTNVPHCSFESNITTKEGKL